MKTILVLLSIALMSIGLGCAALSQYVTPAEIDEMAVGYVVNNDVGSYDEFDGYPNMIKAEKLKKRVDTAHNFAQLDLQKKMAEDNLCYTTNKDVVSSNLMVAQQREEMLFGETGLLSLGLSMAGMGGFAGLLGLMRKRPGDITPPEMESALATAIGKTTEELSAKEVQFVQLVRGVQMFLDTPTGNGPAGESLKTELDIAQDWDTRAAVAVVKAS